MKNKILTFVIGLLVGAIITAAGFLIYNKTNTQDQFSPDNKPEMSAPGGNGGTPPEMPSGEGNQVNSNNIPPEKPENNS